MAKSNKDRQKAYRERHKAARNATVTPAILPAATVTGGKHARDYIGIDGFEYIYLGDWGFGPRYARIVPAICLADPPDPDDTWSPIAYGTQAPDRTRD